MLGRTSSDRIVAACVLAAAIAAVALAATHDAGALRLPFHPTWIMVVVVAAGGAQLLRRARQDPRALWRRRNWLEVGIAFAAGLTLFFFVEGPGRDPLGIDPFGAQLASQTVVSEVAVFCTVGRYIAHQWKKREENRMTGMIPEPPW